MQNFFRKRIFLLLGVGALLLPLATQAAQLTSAQVNAIIGLLQSFGADAGVIANVQSALTGGTAAGGGTQWCHTFDKNIGVGSRGIEVSALTQALSRSGGPQAYGNDERGSVDDIFFNEGFASAVTGFQEKYKSEILTPNGLSHGTGYVGPSTRKKLNQLYGCSGGGIVPNQQIKVLSPNGGEVFNTSGVIPVRWSSSNIPSGNVDIQLMFASKLVYNYPNTPNDGSEDIKLSGVFSSGDVYGNVYYIKIKYPSGNAQNEVSDISDAPFMITSGGTVSPAITVLSPNGGEVWEVGSTHTVTWKSTDAPPNAYVNVFVSSDILVGTKMPPTGSTTWTVPATYCQGERGCGYSPIGNQNRASAILWSSSSVQLTADASDAAFSIIP